MNPIELKEDWPVLGENDPPLDQSRESAAFERERQRLVRDHLGKIALIHGDEVVGVFDNVNDAIVEGYRRFGLVRTICREITEHDKPEFIPHVDMNHPSLRRTD